MEEKLFETDYTKEFYKIEITVCENGNLFGVKKIDENYKLTYDSVIGTLEIVKNNFIQKQSEENRKLHNKTKIKKSKK
jgi:hypothetical protein